MTGLLDALLASDDAALPDRLPDGATVVRLAPAVWRLTPAARLPGARPLILSAGIHGDEAAPVERLCALFDRLVAGHTALRADLLIAFGNLAALRAGRRYVDEDLNRLFGGRHAACADAAEAPRAAVLESAVATFCTAHPAGLHIDLHSAIRASRYACFAIRPRRAGAMSNMPDDALLAACGIEAVLEASAEGPTFSALTARQQDYESYTFELGRVRALGAGRADEFAATDATLAALVSGGPLPAASGVPRRFRVSRELIKHSEAFRLCLDGDVANFTALAPGQRIAEDGDTVWLAEAGEHVVFPNPAVKPGLRAGVLVVPTGAGL